MYTTHSEADLSLQHLQAELERLHHLIHRQVRLWQLADQDPADRLRGLYLSSAQADDLVARHLGASWGQTVALAPPEARAFAAALDQATRQAIRLAELARRQGQPTRLERLAVTFGLDRFEVDTLLICLAPALDLRYERLYGYLQDDITCKCPSVNLVLELLCDSASERFARLAHFAADAPLFACHLPEWGTWMGVANWSLLGQPLQPDPAIVTWLLATDASPDLVHAVNPVAAEDAPVIVFHGPNAEAQDAAARLVAAHLDRPLLQVAEKPPVPAPPRPEASPPVPRRADADTRPPVPERLVDRRQPAALDEPMSGPDWGVLPQVAPRARRPLTESREPPAVPRMPLARI